MQRGDFLKSTVATAVAAELGMGKAQAKVPAHTWGNYDLGSGPQVADHLDQGSFPQYPPDAIVPTDEVVMTTTSSEEVVPNHGKGLVTYITADSGTEEIKSDNIPQATEDLVRFVPGQQLYICPTWREVQPWPGRLEMPDYLKLVLELAKKKNNKRVGLRVQMCAPDYTHEPALPDFVLEKVPKVDLVLSDQEGSASAKRYLGNPHSRYQPRFDHPFFPQAFKELVGLWASEFDGNPLIEFIGTQPDYSRVGNSELLDRTVRRNHWIRSDTIFIDNEQIEIDNEQIEALNNHPPWTATLLEHGLPGKSPSPAVAYE